MKSKFVGENRIESEHWAVELVELGEGHSGDIDENDPTDYSHIRFDVYMRETPESEWDVPDDSSYCTYLNGDTITKKQKRAVLKYLLSEIDCFEYGFHVKKICERLSWVTIETAEELAA